MSEIPFIPSMRPEPARNDRGLYLLPDPKTGVTRAWTRATTIAHTLDDTYHLKYRLRVGVGNGQYRHILDCTRDDLLFAAAESDTQAARNAEAAERYRKLEKLMSERSAAKVGDLSDEDLSTLIGGQE